MSQEAPFREFCTLTKRYHKNRGVNVGDTWTWYPEALMRLSVRIAVFGMLWLGSANAQALLARLNN